MMTSNPRRSLEDKPDPADCLSFYDLNARFAAFVERQNNEHVKRTESQPSAAIFAGDATDIRRMQPRTLALALLRRAVFRTVQTEGIELFGHFYEGTCLARIVGERVELGWFGDNLDRLAVFRILPAPDGAGRVADDATGFLGWAKVRGTLTGNQIAGVVSSRVRQIATIQDAEMLGDQLRGEGSPADPKVVQMPSPKRSRRHDPMTTIRDAAHDRAMRRRAGGEDVMGIIDDEVLPDAG